MLNLWRDAPLLLYKGQKRFANSLPASRKQRVHTIQGTKAGGGALHVSESKESEWELAQTLLPGVNQEGQGAA